MATCILTGVHFACVILEIAHGLLVPIFLTFSYQRKQSAPEQSYIYCSSLFIIALSTASHSVRDLLIQTNDNLLEGQDLLLTWVL